VAALSGEAIGEMLSTMALVGLNRTSLAHISTEIAHQPTAWLALLPPFNPPILMHIRPVIPCLIKRQPLRGSICHLGTWFQEQSPHLPGLQAISK
jgi:hypothetical protein